jgi:hypothetical protein
VPIRIPKKLVIEFLVIVAVMGTAGLVIYLVTKPAPIGNERPIGGTQRDLSDTVRAQVEAQAALDPVDPRRILAVSGDVLQGVRLYASRDGGASWTNRLGPPLLRANCNHDHPTVAIDRTGRQYVAFLAQDDCRGGFEPHVYAGVRDGFDGRWRVRPVDRVPPGRFAYDDRPALAADPKRSRVYIVWTRLENQYGPQQTLSAILFSHSDDGGRTWSRPARLGEGRVYSTALAVAPEGDLYLAIAREGELVLQRSTDGGATFGPPKQVTVLPGPFIAGCPHGNAIVPAVPGACVGPSPTVAVVPSGERKGDVFVTYSAPEADRTQAVWLARFDQKLRRLGGGRIGPPDAKKADQFGPAAAVDPSTGAVWVCYYDTTGDPGRKRTWFTCTASRDGGRRWAAPVRAAASRSDETRFSANQKAYGDREGLVAFGGVAHPVWTDGRRLLHDAEEIYSTSIPLARMR